MASRPNWKGYLKLSLVSCPIALYPAVSAAERVSFRHVNRRTGHRLRHQLVDSVTGEAVDTADKGRGYEIGGGQRLLGDEQDLARRRAGRPQSGEPTIQSSPLSPDRTAATEVSPDEPEPERHADQISRTGAAPSPRPRNTHTIEIERFVPVGQIDARYFEKPYYITPREPI